MILRDNQTFFSRKNHKQDKLKHILRRKDSSDPSAGSPTETLLRLLLLLSGLVQYFIYIPNKLMKLVISECFTCTPNQMERRAVCTKDRDTRALDGYYCFQHIFRALICTPFAIRTIKQLFCQNKYDYKDFIFRLLFLKLNFK